MEVKVHYFSSVDPLAEMPQYDKKKVLYGEDEATHVKSVNGSLHAVMAIDINNSNDGQI